MNHSLARRSLLAAASMAIFSGCAVPTEPVIILNCTNLALSYQTERDLITTPSGLRYRDVVVGPGEEATTGRRVITQYSACLSTGEVYSQALNPSRYSFTLGGGIFPGFEEGVTGMRLGGRRQLVIPASLRGLLNGQPAIEDTVIITVDLVGFQ